MPKYEYGGITEQSKAADRRRADARVLRDNRHWRGAMYLLGYAIECKLKARLMEIYRVKTLEALEPILTSRLGKEVVLNVHSIEQLLFMTRIKVHDRETLRAFHRCYRWKVSWRYASDKDSELLERECAEFFRAADLVLRFIASSI